jgi:hypothetical protein
LLKLPSLFATNEETERQGFTGLGIRSFNPKLKTAAAFLETLRTPEGEPIPPKKAPGVEDGKSAVRPLSPEGMATACRYQAGPQLSSRPPGQRSDRSTQLKIVGSPRPTVLDVFLSVVAGESIDIPFW